VRDEAVMTTAQERSADEPSVSPSPESRSAAVASVGRSRPIQLLDGRGWVVISVSTDLLMLVMAVGAALVGASAAEVDVPASGVIWIYPVLVIGLLALRGMYRPRITVRILDEAARVVAAASTAAMLIIAVDAFSSAGTARAELLARVWVFTMLFVSGGRLVLGGTQRRARIEGVVGKRTLIVGAGQIGAHVERRLDEQPELGLTPIGYIDTFPPPDDQVPGRRAPVLGDPADLAEIVERTGAEHVVLAFLSSRGSDARLVPIVRECEDLGLEISLVPRLFENINVRVGLDHIGGMPLFRLRSVRPRGWEFAIKHVIDRLVAAVLILVLAPILILGTLAVALSSPGKVFFRQRRIGRDGRPFDLLKFRSMSSIPDVTGDNVSLLLPDNTAPGGVEGLDRRTLVGKILRRTSIDELPQLFNVVKGDMSIVGPRPERPEYVELFERRISRYGDRLRVKAGITGWAQVHGFRGKTSLSDRIEWDNYYIENWSLWLDLKIVLMTIRAVFDSAE
jgi:exopolysaccharide biosynthesis polyprenyl glycosylphosphotransferase